MAAFVHLPAYHVSCLEIRLKQVLLVGRVDADTLVFDRERNLVFLVSDLRSLDRDVDDAIVMRKFDSI